MEFEIKRTIKASAKTIYEHWLSSEGHTKMTGGMATVSNKVGENFTAWNGYIEGENLALTPYSKIKQSWRTSQFEENEADSQIEILLNEMNGETEITLIHTHLSASGEHYKQGWDDHYFDPIRDYFSK